MRRISLITLPLMLVVVIALSLSRFGFTADEMKEEMKGKMMEKGKEMMGEKMTVSDLRTRLNLLLQEHVYLAAAATDAALGGRDAEFKAAAAALDANSVALAQANGSVYGPDAEKAFLPLWRKHIGFVVDYTTGVATKNKAKQDKAVADLVAYTQEFGAFLHSASPSLPADAVADLLKTHVVELKTIIDDQAAKNWDKAYTDLHTAAAHMQKIADAHADAIAKQFPEKFASAK